VRSIFNAHTMNMKSMYLLLPVIILAALTARAADDFAWASDNGGGMALIDATAGKVLIPLGGTTAVFYRFMDSSLTQTGKSLWVAQNPSGLLYALDNNGTLYTVVTTVRADRNGSLSFPITPIAALNITVSGTVWISSTLLDIATSQNLYQYNLTTNTITNIGAFSPVNKNNVNISGLAYLNSLLYGVQYSPSPGCIDLISGLTVSNLAPSQFQGANGQSCLLAGAALLYLSDGNSNFWSYSTLTGSLTSIASNFGSIHALTSTSATGGSGTTTPTPSPTATPTPTPTPTPIATPMVTYDLPTGGTLNVTDLESTTAQDPTPCAATASYSAAATATFATGAKIDPAGTLEIDRSYQPTPGAPSVAVPTIWTWSSGPHTVTSSAGQVVNQATNTPLSFSYGTETLALVYKSPTNGTQKILVTSRTIMVYPWAFGQTNAPSAAIADVLGGGAAYPTPGIIPASSPFPSPSPYIFHGEFPRFTVQMNNLYPSGTTSVTLYPNDPSTNPTKTNSQTVQTALAPGGALELTAPLLSINLAQYITPSTTAAQTYTLQVTQQLPAGYPAVTGVNPLLLNSVTFSVTSGYSVNGTVGTVK
jgi:hypothetical protein